MFCFKSLALISKVLFEITLRREWENFSCSNTSKNAVRYIAIKNDFCSFREVALRRSVRRFRRAESGAKVKTFFETTKSFRKIFFENFFRTFFASSPTGCHCQSGCKGKSNFGNSKNLRNFFQNFFRTCRCSRALLSLSKRVQR